MATVNNQLASVISHAAVALQAKNGTGVSSGSNDNFGPAASVSLSAPAQAALAAQPSAGSDPAPSVPATTGASSTDSDTLLLVEEAKQQVIPKVGVQGASEVVDSKGDINQVKLNELIAQQLATAKQAQISFTA